MRFKLLVKYCKTCQQEIWVDQLVLNHLLALETVDVTSRVPYKGKLFPSHGLYCHAETVGSKLDSKVDRNIVLSELFLKPQ